MKTIQTEGAQFSMTTAEFIHLGKIIDTLRSQAEMIAELTRERNEAILRAERESKAERRRAQVFRLPPRS